MRFGAVRVGDAFNCGCRSPIPHEQGVVVGDPSSAAVASVRIAGEPAAARGDLTLCLGSIPGIVLCRPGTVFVRHSPLATEGDLAGHVGLLIRQCASVQVGPWKPSSIETLQRGQITLVVDHKAHTITLIGVQTYNGDGATQAYVDAAMADIHSVWSCTTYYNGEPYTVIPRITARILPPGTTVSPSMGVIHVIHTTQSFAETSSNINTATSQSPYSQGTSLQHDTDLQSPRVQAHEFGHAMGLRDGYLETRDAQGTRHCVCENPVQDVMCDPSTPGARPTDEAIRQLITGDGLHPPPSDGWF